MKNNEDHIEKEKQIRLEVIDIIERNDYLFNNLTLSEEEKKHIIRISISILMKKRYNYPCGGFVESVVNNDLYSATIKSDSTNRKVLHFYAMLNNI